MMGVALKQFRIYVRVIVLVAVVIFVGLVLIKNRGNAAPVWFFWLTDSQKSVNVVWLMLCTAVATLVSWWAVSLSWGLWRDMREVKRVRAVGEAKKELDQRVAALEERERRVDEKLKRAITDEDRVADD